MTGPLALSLKPDIVELFSDGASTHFAARTGATIRKSAEQTAMTMYLFINKHMRDLTKVNKKADKKRRTLHKKSRTEKISVRLAV